MKTLDNNKYKLYSLALIKCTYAMHTELKGIKYFEERDTILDYIWLLEQVKLVFSGLEKSKQNPYESDHIILHNFLKTRKTKHDMCEAYMYLFQKYLQTVDLAGVNLLENRILETTKLRGLLEGTDRTTDKATNEELEMEKTITWEVYKAVYFLEWAYLRHYCNH